MTTTNQGKSGTNFMILIRLSIFYILLVTASYFGCTAFEHMFGLGSVSTVFCLMLGMGIAWFLWRSFKYDV